MAITGKTYNQLLGMAIDTVSTKAGIVLNTKVGSVVRAILEAVTLLVFYLQSLVLAVQNLQRAATATGADLVSWFADFGFVMLTATYNTGQATFTRFTPNASAPLVAVGTIVQASAGNIQYQVVADATNGAFSATLNGYPVAANASSVIATIQAVLPGTSSNLSAGALNQFVSNLPGLDTVTNASAIANALDAETPTAARLRFVLWLNGLSKATSAAIDAAIANVQQGLYWTKLENLNFDGTAHAGWFTVICQDGSGGLATALFNAISASINLTRPFTVGFALATPTNIGINVVMTAVLPATLSAPAATAAKASAVTAVGLYINGLQTGATVPWIRVADVAIDAMIASLAPLGVGTSGISVNAVTLNGASLDVAIASNATARAGSVAVS
jgi:hypothetical protein